MTKRQAYGIGPAGRAFAAADSRLADALEFAERYPLPRGVITEAHCWMVPASILSRRVDAASITVSKRPRRVMSSKETQMAETKELTVHAYPHNGPRDSGGRPKGPREPLVHLLASTEWGDVHSISFHPSAASRVARAIVDAGKAATAGRRRKAIKLNLERHS